MATASASELAPSAFATRPFRVERRVRETADTWTLELEPLDGEALAFAPGQFTMVYAFGVGEVPISISGAPDGARLVHTVRDVGAVSHAICDARPGSVLGIRGPYGNTWPTGDEGADLVIVAGGVGLAPVRPALLHALRHRERLGEVALLYGSRTPEDLLYRRELEHLRGRFDLQVEVTVDAAGPSWRGRVGFAARLIPRASFDPESTTAIVCGPEVMMRFTARALAEAGVPRDRIWISMERNMQCGVGLCGHCQLGPTLICRDGPVYRWDEIEPLMGVREL